MTEKNSPYNHYQKESLVLDNDIFANEDQRRGRPEYFMPPGTEVLKLQEFLEIDLGTRSINKKFRRTSTIFSLMWNLIVMVILFFAVMVGSLFGILFLSIFLFVGSYFMLNTLKSYINTKKVIIEKGMISISEQPIKLLSKDSQIETNKIQQLYVSKYFTGITINEVRIMAYSLSAVTEDKKAIRLIDESNLETVLYLEQEIERFLNIEDAPVYGEILDKK